MSTAIGRPKGNEKILNFILAYIYIYIYILYINYRETQYPSNNTIKMLHVSVSKDHHQALKRMALLMILLKVFCV
jgi:hypothetical protein